MNNTVLAMVNGKNFASKGDHPHVMVMSPTPIPRTLALILYGDLDLSVIDQLPKGRQTIDTFAIPPSKRERAYGFIHNLLEQGRQAYIVCPMIEGFRPGCCQCCRLWGTLKKPV